MLPDWCLFLSPSHPASLHQRLTGASGLRPLAGCPPNRRWSGMSLPRGLRLNPHYTEHGSATVTGRLTSLPGPDSVPARSDFLSISIGLGGRWLDTEVWPASQSALYA